MGLKVDVDTLEGFCKGVPALMEVLANHGVKASFFLSLGPDHSGRALFRIFRQRGFLEKMWRTRAPALYGFKTMFYGTLLPAPLIGAAAPHLLPRLSEAGHEVGLHGYDHVRWHDHLHHFTPEKVAREISQAQETYALLMGKPASSFAAPGWQCSLSSRSTLAAHNFLYGSDTRGVAPYFPAFGDHLTSVLEIPTTLPTLDELLGFHGCRARDFTSLVLSRLENSPPQVLTIHAEVEGGPFLGEFTRLLASCRQRGVEFFRLEDWARQLLREPDKLPVAQVTSQRLPGRAGRVSCQVPLKGRPS
ncbi:MAG: polysaccharide deacetylase family protein [Thermodesulfobacteriota bacterium]